MSNLKKAAKTKNVVSGGAPKPKNPTPEASPLFPSTLRGGLGIVVLGVPGTGKSTFAGSAAEFAVANGESAKLLVTKPREVNSWKYRTSGVNVDAEIFHDPKWRPSLGMYEADGYLKLMRRIFELYDDTEHSVIILDTFTDVVALAAAEILKTEGAATPREMKDSQGFYGSLKYRLKETTQALTGLQFAARPKHVIVTVHTQPPKEDTQLSQRQGGGIKASADTRGAGVEFEGSVLPMIEGGYRREFVSEFDIAFFTDVLHSVEIAAGKKTKKVDYVLQAVPDSEKHAKQTLGPVFSEPTIPNDFGYIMNLLKEADDDD